MKNKYLNIIIVVSLLLAWFIGKSLEETPDYINKLNSLVNNTYEAELVLEKDANPIIYIIVDKNMKNNPLGYLALGEATGYEGKVVTAILINTEGKIVSTYLVEENEWRQWIQKINEANFLKEFKDKMVSDPFSLEKDIDGVASATITSRAITGGVRQAAHYVANSYFGLMPEKVQRNWLTKDIVLLTVIWLLAVIGVLIKKNKLRYVTLLLGAGIIGFWLNATVNLSQFGSIALGRFPSLEINLRWYIMILGILFTTIFFRRNIYCFWICPFGAVQELLYMASGRKSQLSERNRHLFSLIRKILMWAAIIVVLVLRKPAVIGFEPFSVMFSFTGSMLNWVFLFYTLTTGLYSYRFWCLNMCPVGFCINLLAKCSKNLKPNMIIKFDDKNNKDKMGGLTNAQKYN